MPRKADGLPYLLLTVCTSSLSTRRQFEIAQRLREPDQRAENLQEIDRIPGAHFVGQNEELKALVAHMTPEEAAALNRGGHDLLTASAARSYAPPRPTGIRGRQGSPEGRTMLMSPVMVAVAAIASEIVDARPLFGIM